MRLQIGLGSALLLTGALVLSGCGLKYDLYLPEDETNPQAMQQQQGQQDATQSALEPEAAPSSEAGV